MRVPFLTGSTLASKIPFVLLPGVLGVLSMLLLPACGGGGKEAQSSTTPQPVKKVTFMAGFKPQADLPFVAVYVAQTKGFFRDQGLEVDIQHSTGGGQSTQLLATGRVQFSTADAAVVLQRNADPGLPLVALALFGQK